ncbi:hypothetical protein GGQ80_001806 [Sphingomonas jinjuensis]|uniref:Ice-binding protein C-terminal domain-containing protein n=1 Tax=Sphingomonas jinjuensis TaxID=535907 RepID=A0A840F7H5_9SPHN|nr:PEPxxWA-CTERM sorting domain-containing protein [Sphingomonas jinjuensis]MBB4153900.1 hypothetical protein [Sphingomonas jinjuensis]
MKLKNWSAAAMALAAAMTATSATATVFSFELNGAHRAVWTIDTDQPTDGYADGESSYYIVEGNFSDLPGFSAKTNNAALIEFYTDKLDGGFYIEDYYNTTVDVDDRAILTTNGPSVITGPSIAPTFLTGSFVFTNKYNSAEKYSLLITAIPEPASWAMMLIGFGAIGVTMRRRAKGAVTLLA